MFSKRQSFICARTLALWIAVVAVMAGCGGGSSQTASGQGNISVSVIGLPANTSVVLQNNGGNNLTISANGTSSFNGVYSSSLPYAITVSTQPAGATCTITSNSSGVIPNAVVLVGVTCIPNAVSGVLQSVPAPTTPLNVIPVVLDAWSVMGSSAINIPYVSVTVCSPGSTTACQTIDHVQLDTGSMGLRLLNSSLYSNLNLPSANPSNPAIGECMPFGIGVTWGSVVLADIYLNGEVARNIPIQNIGAQPGGVTAVPADCSNTGAIQITQDALGANGILGVGLFVNDCDLCISAIPPISAAYYTCNQTGCTNSAVTQFQVVQNPVASFATDNNGVLISLPAVGAYGASAPLNGGNLIFGIGTSTNNLLGTASVYATDAYGNFTTIYKNVSTSQSFIDSGSNALFFDDATIPLCNYSTWAYCPVVSPLALSATTAAASGSPSILVPFSIVNLDQIAQTNVVAANIGGPAGGYFDWGLPFFFGKKVFTAISGKPTLGGPTGPYFAY